MTFKLKYQGANGTYGTITRNEILRNSRKVSLSTFKREIDIISWKYVSSILGYSENRKLGMVMDDDGCIEYYKSYFISVSGSKRVVYFLKHSSFNYYFT